MEGMEMSDAYQTAHSDGHLDWNAGASSFEDAWTRSGYDLLRFHRGKGFTIQNPPHPRGPKRSLSDIPSFLGPQLTNAHYDDVLVVEALSDGYSVKFRRHEVTTGGDRVIKHALEVIGTPYVLGGTDCSWNTMRAYGMEGVTLPHNAHAQHELFKAGNNGLRIVSKSQIKPGDLLFHHDDDHVSIYLDSLDSGRVIDEEPSGCMGPWGKYIPGGQQIRPMRSGYYCDWAGVCGIGRAESINGKP